MRTSTRNAQRGPPGRAGAALGLLLALGFAPVAEAQPVSVPHTFTDGGEMGNGTIKNWK